MTPAGTSYLNYWYMALSSPFGIELICSDVPTIRVYLQQAKREAKDTDLDTISMCISPFDPSKLWMVKRNPNAQT